MDTFSMMNKFEVDEKNIEERAEEEMDKNRFCAQVIFNLNYLICSTKHYCPIIIIIGYYCLMKVGKVKFK